MLFVLPSPCVGCLVPHWCDLIELLKAPLYPLIFRQLPLNSYQLYPKLNAPSCAPPPSTAYVPPTVGLLSLSALVPASISFSESSSPLPFLSSSVRFRQRQPLLKWAQLSILTAHCPLPSSSYSSCLSLITTLLLHDPNFLICTIFCAFSQTSPSLTHSEASTLFQNMPLALYCFFFHSRPLKLFQLCLPPFYVILLEKCSKILSFTLQG